MVNNSINIIKSFVKKKKRKCYIEGAVQQKAGRESFGMGYLFFGINERINW
jgi:hypothetical protein